MKIFFLLQFHETDSETNSFQKLYSNGSNAYLIDHSKPTTVFVHGFSDSFQPKRNGKTKQLTASDIISNLNQNLLNFLKKKKNKSQPGTINSVAWNRKFSIEIQLHWIGVNYHDVHIHQQQNI